MRHWRAYILLTLCLLLLAGCKEHVHEYASDATPAQCETDGKTVYTCACGDTYTETIPAPGHAWDGGTVLTESSCKEAGTVAYACTVCGEKKEEALPVSEEHVFAAWAITKEATCGAQGVFARTCTVCEKTEEEPIAPTGKHTLGELTVTKAPTCKDEGVAEKVCTVCSYTETEAVPKTDEHTYDRTVTVAATCSAPGTAHLHCTVCGVETDETIPTVGHAYVSTGYVKKPTCSTTGTESFRCTACGATKTDVAPATDDHAWNVGLVILKPTCTQSGSRQITCTLCRAKKTEPVPVDPEAHTWDAGKVTKNPLCVIKGIRTHTCVICKATKQEFIAPSGKHTYKRSVYREATATKEGIAEYTCTLCNTSYMAVIPKTQTGTSTAPTPQAVDPTHLRTSHSAAEYVDFKIAGSTLTVEGKITEKGLKSVWIRVGKKSDGTDYETLIDVESGASFKATFNLSHVTARTPVQIYTHCAGDARDTYWSYIYNSVAVQKENGKYQLSAPAFYEDNVKLLSSRPEKDETAKISSVIQKQSDSIVNGEKDVYKQMKLLHDWVAENIYYDYACLEDKSLTSFEKPEEVLQNRRGVCVGYVNLLSALLQAQGISTRTVSVLSMGTPLLALEDGSFQFALTFTPHVLLEAYLPDEDRWVWIDPTWDSMNTFKEAQWNKGSPSSLYFDVSLEFLSYTHMLVEYEE